MLSLLAAGVLLVAVNGGLPYGPLTASPLVSALVIYEQGGGGSLPNQEAARVLTFATYSTFFAPFDNTSGKATAAASTNSGATAVQASSTLMNAGGQPLGTSSITVPANSTILVSLSGVGLAQFNTVSGGALAVSILRFAANSTFTTFAPLTL